MGVRGTGKDGAPVSACGSRMLFLLLAACEPPFFVHISHGVGSVCHTVPHPMGAVCLQTLPPTGHHCHLLSLSVVYQTRGDHCHSFVSTPTLGSGRG